MKRYVVMFFALFLLSISLYAESDFNVFGGYTSLSLGKVNERINNDYNNFSSIIGSTASKTNIGNGVLLGFDYGYSPTPKLTVGPRLEFLWSDGNAISNSIIGRTETNYTAFMMPLLLGASYSTRVYGPFSVGGDAYFGYGVALAAYKITINNTTENENLNGGSFAADFALNAKCHITDSFDIGIKIGYRRAYVPEMTASSDNTDIGVKKGDAFKDTSGNVVAFDYSGLITSIGFGIRY